MKTITINKSTFSAAFDGVIANNPTISTILSKENNTGFMTKLVTDQLKVELMANLFDETGKEVEEESTEQNTEEVVTEEEPADVEEDNSEDGSESPSEDMDDLDDLE